MSTTTASKRANPALIAGGAFAAFAAVALIVVGLLTIGVGSQRDSAGYLTSGAEQYATPTYALATKSYRVGSVGDIAVPARLVGGVRVDVDSRKPVFVGIGRSADVERYLEDVAHRQVTGVDGNDQKTYAGEAAPAAPASQGFWVASANGRSHQTINWHARDGRWRLVVMNADGSPSVFAGVSVGAEVPHLGTYGSIALTVGLLLAGLATFLVRLGIRRP